MYVGHWTSVRFVPTSAARAMSAVAELLVIYWYWVELL